MAPSARIILALLGVTSAGLLLCAAIIYGSLDRLSLRTAEANVDFLLTQLRNTVEANVARPEHLGHAAPPDDAV